MALVSISNTGPGIPIEDIPFVFDRFYRVQTDRSRQTGGVGLGLAIAQEIARSYGGDIKVESEPGQLATFTVSLPLDPNQSGIAGDQKMTDSNLLASNSPLRRSS